jgi:hypothetical protein
VLKDGEPMDFAGKASRKPLDLLKALIAFGGSDVSQGSLIDALWPELEGDRAQQSFEMALQSRRVIFFRARPGPGRWNAASACAAASSARSKSSVRTTKS